MCILCRLGLGSCLQAARPSKGKRAQPRREITVSATGMFTANSNSNFLVHRATESGGILAGYRWNFNHWASAEANYGWNRNSQIYFGLGFGENRVQSNVNQWTADFVVRTPTWRHFRPYVLGGGGAF